MTLSSMYQPLDPQRQEIRLLRIFPSTELDAPIHCSIFTTSLKDDSPASYQALSYVWGDPKLTAEINVEGTEVPTQIGLNLSLAIRYMRRDRHDVVLWVDALCINQNNNHEKGNQVRMMGLVYNKALEVIAWLGEEEDDSQIAMELIESWATFMAIPDAFGEMGSQPFGAAMLEPIQRFVPMALDFRANLALQALAKRPYWTRAWIYQELALAKHAVIQCGKTSKTLEHLILAHQGLQLLAVLYVAGDLPIESAAIIIKSQNHPMAHMLGLVTEPPGPKHGLRTKRRALRPFCLKTLSLDMLDSFKRLQVTDSRDKIFALLGFVALDGPYSDLITVNYEKSTDQVYLDVAWYLILTEQTLHVLNAPHSRPPTERQWSMPSWVPDWQTDTGRKWTFHHNNSDGEKAVVSSYLFSQLINLSPDGKLLAKGFEVDVISDIIDNSLFPFWPEGSNPSIAFQNFASSILRGPLVNKETALSAYFRLMIYNHLNNHNKPDPQGHRFFSNAAIFLKYIFTKIQTCLDFQPGSFLMNNIEMWPFALTIAFLGVEAAQAEKERLVNLVLDKDVDIGFYDAKFNIIHAGHVIFRTTCGSMGLGPKQLAKGDVLCHLAAHPSPYLLRPAEYGYTNVGDSYVLDLFLPDVVEELIPYMRVFEIT